MNKTTKKIPNIDALMIIEESIKAGTTVQLTVRGNSMSPLLMDGVDVVRLRPFIPAELKPGVIILFRYKERFVLHRIIHISLSDNQQNSEAIITAKGDAMAKTEILSFADVIAIADVPEHSFLQKGYRQLVLLVYKVRGYLIRIVTSK
jgi:hypothetical protein